MCELRTTVYLFNQCLFFILYCILLKKDSLLRILRFPGYFETSLFRTFFPFPLGLRNSGVQLNKRRRFRRQKYGMGIGRMSLHVNLEMPKLPVRGPQQIKTRNLE